MIGNDQTAGSRIENAEHSGISSVGNPRQLLPHIQTELPGPKAQRLIAQDESYSSPSYTRDYPLAVARGDGMMIEDLDGNRFLDFTAGIAVCATGHCHPQVVQAISRQAERLIHMSGTDFYYQPQADLAERLAHLAPGSAPKRIFFANSGAETVEAAIKLARYSTGRKHVLAFRGAFHGRTLGALSLTASKVVQRSGFGPLLPEVSHLTYPNCNLCPLQSDSAECCLRCFDELKELFAKQVAPEDIAAVVVEPIQGEGGYIVPPEGFHRRLRELTEQHGILLVMDEVQAGMGRTGRMFAIEHWGVEPDIICLAKGIASGMPLGALIAKSDLMNWPPGAHASTFGGNPIACAAALETLNLLEGGLVDNAAARGGELLDQLQASARRFPHLGQVRGKGLMVGVEIIRDGQSQLPDPELRDRLIQECFHQGLLLLGCGTSAVRFCPPLIVNAQQIEIAVQILESALVECGGP